LERKPSTVMTAIARSFPAPDFQLLFESAPGLYLVLTPDLHIVAASDAYLCATMTKREEILGCDLFDVFPDNPGDPEADGVRNLQASLGRVLRNRTTDTMPMQKYDIRRPQSQGGGFEERYWSPINSPVLDEGSKVVYIIHRVEDITEFVHLRQMGSEHHKIAEQLRSRAERMEAEVYLRARQLAEANRQRLESIGRLAGGVAHDFNNLLAVILGHARLLKQSLSDGDSFQRGLSQIEHAAESAAALTRQLLAYSRQQVLQPRVLDLNDVLAGVEPLIRRLIGEYIDFQTTLGLQLDRVKADPGQIEQVIMNLAINARDAMPEGGKLIIETSNVEVDEAYHHERPMVAPGHYVMLSVADTGIGINKDVQAHIFEPFFSTKEREKGTGLGLATVYGIVKQSGGYIWVYSEPGMGTTFRVYLPKTEEALQPAAQKISKRPARGWETILLVEDQVALRDLGQAMLELNGYTVLCAQNPANALEIAGAHQGPIHLLLTDVILPKMNGRALAERVTKLRPDIKVLFVSGYTENIIVHHGQLDAGTNFLEKPCTHEALNLKVREVLDRSTPA
jgi:signal transduction histidine kinase/ActR/RegA family two-component response regulator